LRYILDVLLPGLAHVRHYLRGSGPWRVGSDFACDIIVRARGVSRSHLELRLEPGGAIQFRDLASTNGTFLDGHRAEAGTFCVGGILTLGEAQLVLQETITEALPLEAGAAGVTVTGSLDLQIREERSALEGPARRLPFLSMVTVMERILEVKASGLPYQALCEVFAEAMGCAAAKCYEIGEKQITLQAIKGEFPDDVMSAQIVQAAAFIQRPTTFEILSPPGPPLRAVVVPVLSETRHLSFVGVFANGHDPMREGLEAALMTPVALRFLLQWIETGDQQKGAVARLQGEVQALRQGTHDGAGLEPILGRSPAILAALDAADRAADTKMSVLLLGETGTGKELFARRIHALSRRAAMPIVPVNCSIIPESLLESELFGAERGAYTGSDRQRRGFFEEADGGSLFLDEIGDMPLALQPKLLRVLEEGRIYPIGSPRGKAVDVRIIGASNQDLRSLIREGRFRRDLYYRLAQCIVELPPLSARNGDVAVLAVAFLQRANREMGKSIQGFEEEALSLLTRSPWPGNVRELLATVRRLVVMGSGPTISSGLVRRALNLGAAAQDSNLEGLWDRDWQAAKDEFEREYFLRRLRANQGPVSALAKDLKVSRPTIYIKLKKLGLSSEGA
jgi:DNA-binding NtrC family response regulator